jgi:hypothetical protein
VWSSIPSSRLPYPNPPWDASACGSIAPRAGGACVRKQGYDVPNGAQKSCVKDEVVAMVVASLNDVAGLSERGYGQAAGGLHLYVGWVAGFMGANKWNRSGGMAGEHLKVGTEQANALKSGNATEMRRHWTLTTRGGPLPRRQENTRLDVSPSFHVHPKNRRLAAGCNTMNWHGMESLVPLDMTGLPIRASASGFGIAFDPTWNLDESNGGVSSRARAASRREPTRASLIKR